MTDQGWKTLRLVLVLVCIVAVAGIIAGSFIARANNLKVRELATQCTEKGYYWYFNECIPMNIEED